MTEGTASLGAGATGATSRGALVAPAVAALLLVAGLANRWLGTGLGGSLAPVLLPIALAVVLALAIERSLGDERLDSWRHGLAAVGAGLLGGTLLVGAWSKALDPLAFEQTLAAEGLDFVLPLKGWAVIALALEVGLGIALVLGLRTRGVLGASTLLVTFFLFLTGRAYWRFANGIEVEDTSCGCFGNLVERTPAEAFWQDLMVLVPSLLLAFLAVGVGRRAGLRTVAAVAVTVVGVAFTLASPGLPIDDLATRLRPGAQVSDFCAGEAETRLCMPTLRPELTSGEHVVVLAALDDEDFVAGVEGLSAWVIEGRRPPLTVLASATPEESQTFFWTHGPAFEIGEAPEALLRPLYRTLPRSFRVVDGVVVETWPGLPDLPKNAGLLGEVE